MKALSPIRSFFKKLGSFFKEPTGRFGRTGFQITWFFLSTGHFEAAFRFLVIYFKYDY